MSDRPLGRLKPPNREHVKKYRLTELIEEPTTAFVVPPKGTEVGLGLPRWWKEWDQGNEGACVGFGSSAMTSVTNTRQVWRTSRKHETFRYNPFWLYYESQKVDPWPGGAYPGYDQNGGEFYEGTTVNASCMVLKDQGHCRIVRGTEGACDPSQGISAYRWAVTVDEMRAAIYAQAAVSIGVDWYSNFDNPTFLPNGEYWIGVNADGTPKSKDQLGNIRGGHCVCIFRYSDRRKAFKFMNSWGDGYPPTWLPYSVMQGLLDDQGEAAVITDR